MVNDLVVSALSFVLPCNVLQKVLLKAYAFICIYWPERGGGDASVTGEKENLPARPGSGWTRSRRGPAAAVGIPAHSGSFTEELK